MSDPPQNDSKNKKTPAHEPVPRVRGDETVPYGTAIHKQMGSPLERQENVKVLGPLPGSSTPGNSIEVDSTVKLPIHPSSPSDSDPEAETNHSPDISYSPTLLNKTMIESSNQDDFSDLFHPADPVQTETPSKPESTPVYLLVNPRPKSSESSALAKPSSASNRSLASNSNSMGENGGDTSGAQHFIGKQFAGRYTILELLGEGGMSYVFYARHDLLNKQVALKVLKQEYAINRDNIVRFHREALAAATIGDPRIVDITDYGFSEENEAFLVMELLKGRNLKQVIVEEGSLTWQRSVMITRQILMALGAAHAQGIIHRDLKSENIFLVDRNGEEFVKLLDFGASKMILPDGDDRASLTRVGMVLGTPQYLAPEQARGTKAVDHRADIYSMGVILYEMLTGKLPFCGEGSVEVILQHLNEPPPSLRQHNPQGDFPDALDVITLKALAKDPNERFMSTAEMAAALPDPDDPFLKDIPLIDEAPGRQPKRKRRTGLLIVMALIILLAGGSITLFYLSGIN